MAKGHPFLMPGYGGGPKYPRPATPKSPSGQDLVNKFRGNTASRKTGKKKKRTA